MYKYELKFLGCLNPPPPLVQVVKVRDKKKIEFLCVEISNFDFGNSSFKIGFSNFIVGILQKNSQRGFLKS